MTKRWLAEHNLAPNWYAGTVPSHPITSLLSQARKTESEEKCRAWCDKNEGFHPKLVDVPPEWITDA